MVAPASFGHLSAAAAVRVRCNSYLLVCEVCFLSQPIFQTFGFLHIFLLALLKPAASVQVPILYIQQPNRLKHKKKSKVFHFALYQNKKH
jgi:hypothetical protein